MLYPPNAVTAPQLRVSIMIGVVEFWAVIKAVDNEEAVQVESVINPKGVPSGAFQSDALYA